MAKVSMQRLSVLALVVFALPGCTPAPPPTFPISGRVSFDGKPLPEGEVYFGLPGQAPAIFPVKDGRFEGKARAGVHRVEICAYRPRTKKSEMPDMIPPPENYIPAQFNAESKLTATVEPDGANRFDFATKK